MKALAITFVIALILSSLANGFLYDVPPHPVPVGLTDVKESNWGLERNEGNIPELVYTDDTRGTKFMTDIKEKSSEDMVEFPMGSAN